ncbi:unnamed protein product, partial [Urochloa humidicola]
EAHAAEGNRNPIIRHNERPNARHPLTRRATGAASPALDDGGLRLSSPGVLAAAARSTEPRLPPRRAPRPRPGRGAGTPRRRRRLLPRHPCGRVPSPGPKEMLREQKKKSASYLLAPIAASRDTLLKAQALLASPNASAEDAEEVMGRIGAAGRDCVPRQRNSIVAFQSKTGVENAASLLTNKDPLKVEADTRLGELIQSFSDLGTVVENSNFELIGDREKMKDGLLSTISALDEFEQSVKDCLGL